MASDKDYSLRPLVRDDLERVLAWRNSDQVRSYMYHDDLISWAAHERWFNRVAEDARYDYQLFCYQTSPIGLTSASQIDRDAGTCFWGLYIGEQDAPPGSGSWLGYYAMNHMFDALAMRKVICEVLAFNKRAIRLYEKLGFEQEGCFRRHVLKNGRYEDVVSMALFVENWQKTKKLLERDDG